MKQLFKNENYINYFSENENFKEKNSKKTVDMLRTYVIYTNKF